MAIEPAAKVEEFFASYNKRHYSKGQILLMIGDTPKEIFYLKKGKVRMYDVTYKGEEIILNVFKPKAFFPMSLALDRSVENKYIYEAETDIELVRAPVGEVLAFVSANSDVLLDLLRRLYSGMDGILGRMSYLMAGSAKSRLLYELVIEARRFGQTKDDGSCMLSITEKDLGARAGLSRETVSREMHKLKASKQVEIKNKDIVILDIKQIETQLGLEI